MSIIVNANRANLFEAAATKGAYVPRAVVVRHNDFGNTGTSSKRRNGCGQCLINCHAGSMFGGMSGFRSD